MCFKWDLVKTAYSSLVSCRKNTKFFCCNDSAQKDFDSTRLLWVSVPLYKNFPNVLFFDKCLLWVCWMLNHESQIPSIAQHLVNDDREGWLWRYMKLLRSLLVERLYQRTLPINIRHQKLPHWNSVKELDAIWSQLGLKVLKKWA